MIKEKENNNFLSANIKKNVIKAYFEKKENSVWDLKEIEKLT